jgi:uncharacterized protein (DUF2235 family)
MGDMETSRKRAAASGTSAAAPAAKPRAASKDPTSPTAGPATFKRILLFSDGTGNSSASLMKTNVWRMYEMVDLGPAPEGQIVQIGYYSNGVGTSNFEPLAALGGIFGIGLRRNVLTLYEFLCRTYNPGDEILAFGFSRGAFTIRLLVHLIASQGVINYGKTMTEAELRRRSREAFRRMYSEWRLNSPVANTVRLGLRKIAAFVRGIPRRLRARPVAPAAAQDTAVWTEPKITFVGLWDTVAAYGGPIVELTRGVDDWIWPLTMPDYRLSKKVLCARHALALDDRRDSFQPLLWDETVEDDAGSESPRLKQVWFTGMHADVGGGYPDDSLSYVSLTWMIEELGPRARLLDTAVARAYDLANDFGPMHDSRQGIGSYYRYQPRRIEAFLDPPTERTLGMRDPNVRKAKPETKKSELQGLIAVPRIHESVFRRLLDGTDGYAPISLPRRLRLVRRAARTPHADRLPALPDALETDLDSLADEARDLPKRESEPRDDPLDRVWNIVWARRVVYFLTVILTLVLIVVPLQPPDTCGVLGCGDDRLSLSPLTSLAKGFLPGFTHGWLDAWSANPWWVLLLAGGISVSMWLGARLEGRATDLVRHAWTSAVGRVALATDEGRTSTTQANVETQPRPRIAGLTPRWWSRLRDSAGYQRAVQGLKWRVTPTFVGPALILVAIAAGIGFFTQLRIFWHEEGGGFCSKAEAGPPGSYAARRTCNPTGRSVQADHEYLIRFEARAGADGVWRDRGPFGDGVPASIAGVRTADETALMIAAAPLKRVVRARYLQPIAILRGKTGARPHLVRLDPVAQGKDTYVARLRAPVTGTLSLFANDAVPPGLFGLVDLDLFYDRNTGEADVTLCEVNVDCPDDASGGAAPAP